jgi:putative phosphoesterase
MQIALIADTHLTPGRELPAACTDRLRASDVILHAGDFVAAEALNDLAALGPCLIAVHGNRDDPEVIDRLPETTTTEVEGIRFALIHDAGPATGRLERMRTRFPDADVVLFGHSHMPLHAHADGFHIFNPGSPTQRRRAPHRTIGLATAKGGRIRLRHVPLD